MKKIILLSALCLSLTAVSLAGEKSNAPDPGFAVIQNGPVLKVFYKGTKPCNVKISILDSNMQRVFSESLRQTAGFARPYNMEQLPQGEYVVEVTDDSGASRQTVVIPGKKTGKGFHIEKVHDSSDRYLLMAAKDVGAFEVKVVDRNGRTVYNESKNIKKDFAQVYNLSALRGEGFILIRDSNGNEQKVEF
jgi:hypothetical protein